ncbi:hypothetical protein WJX75_003099 [Coccomyxa subellipsoidea]|uniref:Fe2OG dioxygenase domain-containing protein n=1 Tax=Coccomyxa subellipsoidea TaxID=248742 RepID=A0ABR2YC15_9CHLO
MIQSVLRLVQIVEDLQSAGALEVAASFCVVLLNTINEPRFDAKSSDNAVSAVVASRIGQVAYLVLLGCTNRLSDVVLQSSRHSAIAPAVAGSLDVAHPCILFPALPDDMFQALKRGFSAGANFWSETGYFSHDTPFSSVLYNLEKQPGNAIEAAISSLYQELKRSNLDMEGILAAEWWVHMRDPTSAHQLHFDLDEGRIGAGAAKYRLVHPVLSSVLYLSGAGGPTVVLEQSATDGLAERAFLGTPSENTLFCFPGNYLHGVLPGGQASSEAPGGVQRISLIIACPCETPGGECAQHESEIYTQRRDVKNGLSPSMPSERAGLLATSNLPLPGLRFFLRSAEEIQQVYVPQK